MSHTDLPSALHALAPALGGTAVQGLTRLSGGASQETWSFQLTQAEGAARRLILRRAPPGRAERRLANPSSRAAMSTSLGHEYALLQAAAAAGVPVPPVVWLLQAEQGLGEGYVMGHVAGETLGRRIVNEARLHGARQQLAYQCGQALARIHALPLAGLPALRRAGPNAELEQYQHWHAGHGTRRPVFELALRWLAEHLPNHPPETSPAMCLVHGDFRNGNLMIDEQGLAAVLDWELAHIGDPMEDLGWICVNAWRFGRSELPVGGFGTLAQLFAGYSDAGGQVDAQRVHFWHVMGTLKWGLVCDGMAQAWLDGSEPVLEKAAIGRRASETEIDLLELLAPR